jgi:DNA-binding CsgD family transcriptional regulator
MGYPGDRLLERELETAHLQRAVDHSWHGVGRLVVIEGSAGIGKTTLVATTRELARAAGMHVRSARGSELEQNFAFGVVRQLFDPLLATASDAQRSEWLSGAAELAVPLFDARAPMQETAEDSVYPRLHGLYWMCCNLARQRPLALCVDDAHWGDEPSLAFLGFLARRLDELPILLIVAVRSMAADAPGTLGALVADSTARVLTLRGLSADGVQRLLAVEGDGPVERSFAHACHHATAGNPFLLRELVKELEEARIAPVAANVAQVGSLGAHRVADAVLRRLARLSPHAPALARAVAILGDEASIANAARLANLDQQTAIDVAGTMRAGELLGNTARLTFAHPIIRSAIYHSILPAERLVRHARAATVLYERGAPAEQVAAQILLADGVTEPWVLEQLGLAAGSALAMGAPRSAAAYLRRALGLEQGQSDRAALLARLGHAEVLAGLPEAADHLEEAVRLTSDPDERARVAIVLAQLLKYTGRVPRAVELLSDLPPATDPTLRERIETEMLSGALMSDTAHKLLAERLEKLEDQRTHARCERERIELVVLAFERMNANRPKGELLDLLTRAGPGPDFSDDRILLPPAVMTAAATLSYLDEFDQAEAICRSVIEPSRQRGSLASLLIGLAMRAQIAYRRGDLPEALADAETAFRLATDVAAVSTVLRLHPLATINNVAVEQERSESALEELLDTTDQSLNRDTLHVSLTLLSRARLLLALGRSQAALDQLLEFAALPRAFATGAPAFLAWRSDAALILHQLGDQPEALRLAREEVELAQAMGATRAVGVALRAFGLVHKKPALNVLREAVSVLERSPARLECARALVDLGAAMRRAGERSASRAPLREGHDLAVLCGATNLAQRARQELVATGLRVSPAGLQGVAALTPSERRVAELAAQGLTNRDIAQSLFITEKTVETHLGHVYDKLDVRSRHKLADMLAPAATAA